MRGFKCLWCGREAEYIYGGNSYCESCYKLWSNEKMKYLGVR